MHILIVQENDDPDTPSVDTTTTRCKSNLANDSKSNDELAIPSHARGKVLSLMPDTDPRLQLITMKITLF